MNASPLSRRHTAVRLEDVASAAGVSSITVMRVLRGEDIVKRQTRERVEAAITALEYVPGKASLRSIKGRPVNIGLLHAEAGSANLDEFLIGGLEQAHPNQIHIVAREFDAERFQDHSLAEYFGVNVDGVVVSPELCGRSSIQELLTSLAIPIVAVAPPRPTGWDYSVRTDAHRAAYDMTLHLAGLGHRRIALVAGEDEYANATHVRGFTQALLEFGFPDSPELLVLGPCTYLSGLDAAERLLDLDCPPSAILVRNDEAAAAIISCAHARGLEVPSDLTVCGLSASGLATKIWPGITTMQQPIRQMTGKAVDLLARAVRLKRPGDRNRLANPHILADNLLVRRQSDAAPRTRPSTTSARVR
jgi:LacI family transcriptional regulator